MLKCLVFLSLSLSVLPFLFLLGKQRWLSFYGRPHTRTREPHLHTHICIFDQRFLPFRPFDLLSLCDFHWFSIIFNWQGLSEVLTSSSTLSLHSHAQLSLSTDCMAEEFNKFAWLVSPSPPAPPSMCFSNPCLIFISSCSHYLCFHRYQLLPLPQLSLFMHWSGLKFLGVGSGSVIYLQPNRNSSMASCQIPPHSLRKRPRSISFQCNNSTVSRSKHFPGTT